MVWYRYKDTHKAVQRPRAFGVGEVVVVFECFELFLELPVVVFVLGLPFSCGWVGWLCVLVRFGAFGGVWVCSGVLGECLGV